MARLRQRLSDLEGNISDLTRSLSETTLEAGTLREDKMRLAAEVSQLTAEIARHSCKGRVQTKLLISFDKQVRDLKSRLAELESSSRRPRAYQTMTPEQELQLESELETKMLQILVDLGAQRLTEAEAQAAMDAL